MRTLRLTLAATVIVVLLGGLGGAVLAQEEAATSEEPVVVTGTFTWGDPESFGRRVEDVGVTRTKGVWWIIGAEASDGRLSGRGTKSSNWNSSWDTEIGIGADTYVLANPDGRWVGSGHNFTTGPSAGDDLVVLRGEGGYDGLTAALSVDTIDWSGIAEFEGVIILGEAPEIPEPVEPPAE